MTFFSRHLGRWDSFAQARPAARSLHQRPLPGSQDRPSKLKELGRRPHTLESSLRGDTHDLRAVKIISKHQMTSFGIDYKRELFALAKISKVIYQQENIFLKFLGWHESPSNIHILMEYFHHGDLSKHITAGGPISEQHTKKIATDILRGLCILHKEDIAHRDLKPKNILVVQKPPDSPW